MGATTHAKKRIKSRLGLPKRLADELSREARSFGHGQADFTGAFGRYLNHMGREYMTSPIVYKGNIYIFGGNALITAWPVPQQFRKYTPKGVT